jgi:hypothetical protein
MHIHPFERGTKLLHEVQGDSFLTSEIHQTIGFWKAAKCLDSSVVLAARPSLFIYDYSEHSFTLARDHGQNPPLGSN